MAARNPTGTERIAGFFSGKSGASRPTRDLPSLLRAQSLRAFSRDFTSFSESGTPAACFFSSSSTTFLASAATFLG